MCLSFELFIQTCSKITASCQTEFSKSSFISIFDISRFFTPSIIKEIKFFSSSLSFLMDHSLISTLRLWMPISTVIRMWSEGLQISEWRIICKSSGAWI